MLRSERRVRWLAPSMDSDRCPVWSPDGTRLAFVRFRAASIMTPSDGAGGGIAGWLHQAPIADMAHFRGRGAVWQKTEERWQGSALVGLGLAEVQRTSDRPGFVLGDEGEGAVEAAGPEVSISGQGRYWLDERAYAVVDANVGVAYMKGAPSVIGKGGPVVPFLLVTAGVGF